MTSPYFSLSNDKLAADNPEYSESLNRHRRCQAQSTIRPPQRKTAKLGSRIDEFFRDTKYPTWSGLALYLGFHSINHMKQYIESLTGNQDNYSVRIVKLLTKARTRLVLHYEESMQSGRIAPAAARFALEVLGFQIEQHQYIGSNKPSPEAAAKATRSGYDQALLEQQSFDRAMVIMDSKNKKQVVSN